MTLKFKRFAIVLGLCALASLLPVTHADAQDAASKLGRGFAGLTLGILEIPGNIYDEGNRNGWLSGATVGFGKGLGMFIARELVGAWELITFPIPAPDEYNPIITPDYPWGYFNGEGMVTVPAVPATAPR